MDDQERIKALRQAMTSAAQVLRLRSWLRSTQLLGHVERSLTRGAVVDDADHTLDLAHMTIRALRSVEDELRDAASHAYAPMRAPYYRQVQALRRIRQELTRAADRFLTDTQPISVKNGAPDDSGAP